MIQPFSSTMQTLLIPWSLLLKRYITPAGVADHHVLTLTDDTGRYTSAVVTLSWTQTSLFSNWFSYTQPHFIRICKWQFGRIGQWVPHIFMDYPSNFHRRTSSVQRINTSRFERGTWRTRRAPTKQERRSVFMCLCRPVKPVPAAHNPQTRHRSTFQPFATPSRKVGHTKFISSKRYFQVNCSTTVTTSDLSEYQNTFNKLQMPLCRTVIHVTACEAYVRGRGRERYGHAVVFFSVLFAPFASNPMVLHLTCTVRVINPKQGFVWHRSCTHLLNTGTGRRPHLRDNRWGIC